MGKRLIVAEKPSVGRDIAHVLNCKNNENGYIVGDNDIVTWAVGHLVRLLLPPEINPKFAVWDLDDLPIIPKPFLLGPIDNTKKQFELVKELMNDPEVDSIVCATDAGREGELIFRYIYQMAECAKPVQRLWISSLTYQAIKKGFENLKPASAYDNLYESAKCRNEADWLIGINASRAYAIVHKVKGLSVGRVMSPTLAILVERELERRNFVPEQYCETVASFHGYEGLLLNQDNEDTEKWSYFSMDEKERLESFAAVHTEYGTVNLVSLDKEMRPSQLLYDLTSLQRDANRIFGMSSQWTLDTAQSLYEKRAITYPRTDSRYLTSDIKSTFPKRLNHLAENGYKDYAELALTSEKELFGKYINDKGVSDHHAIIPTGEAKEIESWSEPEKKIYDLIARRFIAMFFPDMEIMRQRIQTDVDGKVFVSYGEKVLKEGWSAVDYSRTSGLSALPDLSEGVQVKVQNIRVRFDETKPPAPHTEASLLAAMEHAGKCMDEDSTDNDEKEFGIGTPATRADIIEKLIDKKMADRKGKALIPTEYGIKLVQILPKVLQSPEVTGEWEERLAKIRRGEESPDTFMNEIQKLSGEIVQFAIKKGDTNLFLGPCPLCQNPVKEGKFSYYCTNQECKFVKIPKVKKGLYPTLSAATMVDLLEYGTASTAKGTYTIDKNGTFPFIHFEHAPKPDPDYEALQKLIKKYGFNHVNKVQKGGALWISDKQSGTAIKDFLKESSKIGCDFQFSKSSKALKGDSGYYLKVEPANILAFIIAFSDQGE